MSEASNVNPLNNCSSSRYRERIGLIGSKLGVSWEQASKILSFCLSEKSILELSEMMKLSNRTKFKSKYINPLLKEGLLPIVAKDFGHKSMTRNPLIFGLFTRMHLVEKVASGIPRMQEAMKEANLPEPEFHTDGMFTVAFKRVQKNEPKTTSVSGLSQACPKLKMRYIRVARSPQLHEAHACLNGYNQKSLSLH